MHVMYGVWCPSLKIPPGQVPPHKIATNGFATLRQMPPGELLLQTYATSIFSTHLIKAKTIKTINLKHRLKVVHILKVVPNKF